MRKQKFTVGSSRILSALTVFFYVLSTKTMITANYCLL